ncbi:MAG: metallophosphatase family protein [Planctomycetia bacterium]|nr:metallophosphatase family protein [Planctomycetia bacterium]
MWAILSDIHGNLEALDAVLADIARRPVGAIFCLGDIVGYGPNPVECIDRAMKWDVVLLGNHDQAAMVNPDGFGAFAERAIFWTRHILESTGRNDLWNFLAERPRSHREGDFLFVHGSPRNPTNEYIFPEDIFNEQKLTKIAAMMERYCFCGHTHMPGVFVELGVGSQRQVFAPEEIHHFWRFDGRKTIVNVGSVGQPRDGNWRACYVLVDGWDVWFRRVEYDWQTTRDKIYKLPDIDDFYGDRLGEGR